MSFQSSIIIRMVFIVFLLSVLVVLKHLLSIDSLVATKRDDDLLYVIDQNDDDFKEDEHLPRKEPAGENRDFNSGSSSIYDAVEKDEVGTKDINVVEAQHEENQQIIPLAWNETNWNNIFSHKYKDMKQNVLLQVDYFANDLEGIIQQDGQLVVNLFNKSANDIMFWGRAQRKLCAILCSMTFVENIPSNKDEGNEVEDTIELPKRPLLNLTLDCLGHMKNTHQGQGNWIQAIYTTRIAAAAAQVDLQIQCYEGNTGQLDNLFPWFATKQPAPSNDNRWPYKGDLPTEKDVCTNEVRLIRVDLMIDEIMDDIQRMAVTLIGSRGEKKHPSIPVDQPPLVRDVDIEDVVIHYRCGDIMGVEKTRFFGMIKFTEYTKWISKDTKTIGIVTQPFVKKSNRIQDRNAIEQCREATYLMVDILQESLPSAIIKIHNSVNDTLPLTFARLAMANQSFTTLSSFGIYPVVGGFGKGYFQKGNKYVNPFNIHFPEMYPEKLFMMNSKVLSSSDIMKLGHRATLDWLADRETH